MDKSVPAESEYAVTEFPLTLYAEGDSAGSTHIITASHDESGAKDKVKYTVIEVDLSGPHQFEDDPSIENELEEFKEGSYVVLNDDDQSSENQEWDLNDPIIEKVNDDRVLGLDLTATPGDLSEDKVTLDWSPTSKLNVYKIDTGGTYTEVSPGEELDSDSLPTLKIEGVEASDSMKDIVMTASYTRESDGSASGTAEDEIRLTVVSVDVDGDSNRDGAVDDDDDKMEMDDTQGVLVWVNDDDSNADGTIDNSNTAIDGPADATQMTDITVRKVLPDDIPAGTVLLSGADNVRIFKSDGTMVKPASGDSGAAVDLWSDLPVTLKAEGVTSGQSELTVTYSFTKADGGVVTFTDKMQVTVIKVELTGHRPTNEGPAYGDPFQRHEIPDDEEETPGVGIRVNGDTEPAADENDLIEVIIDVEPFPIPSGVESFLRRSNDDITVWDSQTMGTALLDSGTEAAVTINTSPMSIWVENPDGGDADLDLVAKDGSGNDVALDKLHFFPFTSVVVVFEGENGVPADPPVTGVSQLALDIYESGYDVHLFEEPDLGDDPNAEDQAFDEIENAVENRQITSVAIIGYSHGGGSTFNVSEELDNDATAFNLAFTAYIDAISQPLVNISAETRRPVNSAFHVNYFQTANLNDAPLFLDGAFSVPNGAGFEDDVDNPVVTESHVTIDDAGVVHQGISSRLYQTINP